MLILLCALCFFLSLASVVLTYELEILQKTIRQNEVLDRILGGN